MLSLDWYYPISEVMVMDISIANILIVEKDLANITTAIK